MRLDDFENKQGEIDKSLVAECVGSIIECLDNCSGHDLYYLDDHYPSGISVHVNGKRGNPSLDNKGDVNINNDPDILPWDRNLHVIQNIHGVQTELIFKADGSGLDTIDLNLNGHLDEDDQSINYFFKEQFKPRPEPAEITIEHIRLLNTLRRIVEEAKGRTKEELVKSVKLKTATAIEEDEAYKAAEAAFKKVNIQMAKAMAENKRLNEETAKAKLKIEELKKAKALKEEV